MKATLLATIFASAIAAAPAVADTFSSTAGSFTGIGGGVGGTGTLSGGFGGTVSMADPQGGGSTSAATAFGEGTLTSADFGQIGAAMSGNSWSYQTTLNNHNQYRTEGGGQNTTATQATLGGAGTANVTAGSGTSFNSWTPPLPAPAQ